MFSGGRRRVTGLIALSLIAIALPANMAANSASAAVVDLSNVPHYFGPWANWANSPRTLPDATVTISDPGGHGTGAAATASVGANGTVLSLSITSPGANYDESTTVSITGAGTGAAAYAVVALGASVSTVDVTTPGAGYDQPAVTIGGGATATAFGGVDSISLLNAGSGYTMPTVDFDAPDDPNGVKAEAHATWDPTTGVITGIVIDNAGSGYSSAPGIMIYNGTALSPLVPDIGAPALVLATASTTINVLSVTMDSVGAGYTTAPTVTISEASPKLGQPGFVGGSGATANANIVNGAITDLVLTSGGSGYITPGGIEKFTDALPGLCDPSVAGSCPTAPGSKYIPLAVADTASYPGADTYQLAVVQYMTSFSSSLPDTLVRGYVQLETPANASFSQHVPLVNVLRSGETQTVLVKGQPAFGVTPPQYLGPIITATKDRATRVIFRNLLPTGAGGDLFLPMDSTMMGSGEGNMNMPYDPAPTTAGSATDATRNPMCTTSKGTMGDMCFAANRATLHLHGGNTPWISDGTVNQWTTPAGEKTAWPQGVAVHNVPDMSECAANEQGCLTFFYTNQQSARLMLLHDHAFGITRLNVYAGEATAYLLTDSVEQKLIADGTIPSDQIPLVIQDKTFVPSDAQMYDQKNASGVITSYGQDPTWDKSRWGGEGSLWYHHVYMPAQNPSAPNGTSSYGRWLYGPWFWPPATDAKYGPIVNPYFDANCNLDDPSTWQYQVAPYCEPAITPGTPNISAGMEQFNDTPIVNGTAYPTLTVDPKSYRLRILNAANDRFFNLQWYVGETSTASTHTNKAGQVIGATEVALKADQVAAAKTDPTVFPTPDTALSPAGPDWIQIGTEGGFLPAPAVVSGHQPTTWITDVTRFDAGNADKHSLLLGNAERADVVVDFSKYAGKTLILYNDAPSAFPARSPLYDYYTGNADLSPSGAPTTLPGYGPNTRTIMQIKVAAATPTPAFNLIKLRKAFSHKADGSGVFEASANPIVVGQAAYNTAYGTNFVKTGYCSAPSTPSARCDGLARIDQQGGTSFKFDTLSRNRDGTVKQISLPVQPKSMHDETNATSYDEYGRMQANLGVELYPATPGNGGAILYQFSNPATEIFDGTGMPTADMKVQPISTTSDGTQIWKITHNGVDTHPIHFHSFDVQLINRVTWDNIILPPDDNELGWKETVRISPLEDTYIAIRPVLPKLPWELPNSIHKIDVLKPLGATLISNTIAAALGITTSFMSPDGNPSDLVNHYANYGAEFLWHCHILSHEEMDMMRPIAIAYAPVAPTQVQASIPSSASRIVTLRWMDSSVAETSYLIQRRLSPTSAWVTQKTIRRPITDTYTNTVVEIWDTQTVDTLTVPAKNLAKSTLEYRVVAQNTVGDTWNYSNGAGAGVGAFPTVTAKSYSAISGVVLAPTDLKFGPQSGKNVNLEFTNMATGMVGFQIEVQLKGTKTWTVIASNSLVALPNAIIRSTVTLPAGPRAEYVVRAAVLTKTGLTIYSNAETVTG
jgi:FtsP/CotA-like multicopper oxidase with cupredoxin domain